jgi:hypothetical protein
MRQCFECGSTKALHDHHVVSASRGGTKTIPLCGACHSKVHSLFALMHSGDLTRSSLGRKRDRGEKTGGKVPFGYSADADGRLTINEKEQDACRLMSRMRKDGYTLQAIISELDYLGIKTRCGGKWYPSVVARIIDAEPRAVAA